MIGIIALIFVALALVLFPIVWIVAYMVGIVIALLIRFARWAWHCGHERAV
jgi:hypothetical protein